MNPQLVLAKILVLSAVMAGASGGIAKPGCQDECGGVQIPFPFGIGEGCFGGPSEDANNFQVMCNTSTDGKPILYMGYSRKSTPALSISIEDHSVRVSTEVAYECYNASRPEPSTTANKTYMMSNMYGFNISSTKNLLIGIGCDTMATVLDSEGRDSMRDTVGCVTSCPSIGQLASGTCPGVRGCCATSIFNTMETPSITAGSLLNYSAVTSDSKTNHCSLAFVAEAVNGSYAFSSSSLTASPADYDKMRVPVVFNWYILYTGNCTYGGHYLCGNSTSNTTTRCVNESVTTGGIPRSRCQCLNGYAGNPYLGCQDVDECSNRRLHVCQTEAHCVNTNGSYECKCPNGFRGDATLDSPCIPTPNVSKALTLGLGIGLGSIIGFILLFGLFKLFIRQKRIRERAHNFKTNGGLLLQQDMSSNEGAIDKTKIFNQSELEKATDNFNDDRVLGRGGQGTVYKGMLTDGTIVAVKKSVKIDETQLTQFINEVVILSQINHRNIVKLFGCCLETEVPLLIYEFVPYGTLYQHIHHPNEDFQLTWRARLQIAVECAGAIAYLHSSCSCPIYHRDIKSSNILLDEKYRAKISDFGTSRTISIDKTHVTTCVQGTFGYLDPEFFQSSQFTDKSDVYSFGVVLLELLTSKKPIFTDSSNEPRGLATEFVQLLETNANELSSILDPQVLQHCSEEEIEALAKLIKRCLSLNGKQRPSMKEVARTLEMINSHQGGEEGNSATEDGNSKQDGVTWADVMGMMNEGPCTSSTTSAFTDSSYSIDVQPLLCDSK